MIRTFLSKKLAVVLVVVVFLLAGFSIVTGEEGPNKRVRVAVCLADMSDYYIGTMVGKKVVEALRELGAEVEVLDAASQITTQLNQIQTAVTKGVDVIYVFSPGIASGYMDILKKAREVGVKVIVSHNYLGDGTYDVFIGSEEFYMGAMQAAMVSRWIDEALPEAKRVKALILEAQFNETMAHRCLGMRLIGEKFIRKADLRTMHFVKKEGPVGYYRDVDGQIKKVEEPTGGLILDKDGYAILNPFYDSRVELLEFANRATTGVNPVEAQSALESVVAQGHDDLQVIMAYGDIGIPLSQKMIEMCESGRTKHSVDQVAVFCSDATDANLAAMHGSIENMTVLRGVMAQGNIVETICDYAKKLVKGELTQEERIMMPASYTMVDKKGNLVTVYYEDLEKKIPVPIDQIFGR